MLKLFVIWFTASFPTNCRITAITWSHSSDKSACSLAPSRLLISSTITTCLPRCLSPRFFWSFFMLLFTSLSSILALSKHLLLQLILVLFTTILVVDIATSLS
ncbi:hypothetical protein AYI70_g10890 [Smittium culicis]|uniref:Uncharacterized protein n=1 Tax=Smittium culicis TaxID=133412 RepID=A0A1R1X4F3_9FUNG|nr:hypothetical protein AYI70_g10890 [Smittium culicis]